MVQRRAGVSAAQKELIGELDILQKKLANPRLTDKYRTKKQILRDLTKVKFKKPYTAKWWKELRDLEVTKLLKNGNFHCPECDVLSIRGPTLQHLWHPDPYRVLCTQQVNDQQFREQIPAYIKLQKLEKKALCKQEYEKWWKWKRFRNAPSYTEKGIIEYGVSKARSNFALGYFSADEILIQHLDDVKRHIQMHREDYKYVCGSCAYREDKDIIESGRLVRNIPYFLLHDGCARRDVLAQALIEAFVATL